MFNKTLTIFTDPNAFVTYSREEIRSSFVKIPENLPTYFKTIPKEMFHPGIERSLLMNTTIKKCSGFINLFKRSFLFKSPFDIQVIFNDTGIEFSSLGKETETSFISLHPNTQLLDYVVQNKKYKFIAKIILNIHIDSEVPVLMHNSWYHFLNYETLPGIISPAYKSQLNFFIPIEKDRKELLIRVGDPLFLLTPLTEKNVDIVFKEKQLQLSARKTFSDLKRYILNKL